MNHDNEKDVKISTTPKDDGAVCTTEPSDIKRELSDSEIASVAGGYVVVGQQPPSPKNPYGASPQ